MFFIIGVDQGQKELGEQGPVTCGSCGRYGRYQIYMTYMCLSLFFIPVLKWGKTYYVKTSCCQSLYELNPETGKRLHHGEQVEIQVTDLTLIRQGAARGTYTGETARGQGAYGNPGYDTSENAGSGTDFGRKCLACGYETMEDFDFCPKCGEKLRYKVS